MEKIKHFFESDKGKYILTVIIVILVGLSSFGLGRLSKNSPNSGIKIEYPNQAGNATWAMETAINTSKTNSISQNSNQKKYFASSKGKKYYSISCSAGKTIKQENRIYFATVQEAEDAGYTLSSSCN